MTRMILICAALLWTGAMTVAFAQENPLGPEKPSAKHANVHHFHHGQHAMRHNRAAHHKAMAAGQASIASHPSHGNAAKTRHAKKVYGQ
jgi:hypothetical protein